MWVLLEEGMGTRRGQAAEGSKMGTKIMGCVSGTKVCRFLVISHLNWSKLQNAGPYNDIRDRQGSPYQAVISKMYRL